MKTEIFTLDSQYSTTRCVIRTQPIIENNPEDKIHAVLFLPENLERKAEGGLRTQGYFKNTQIDKPLISVITVVFNGAEYLEQTINSVIGQTYDNVEYIIIDGGSTDGTLDVIKKYEGQIDYWVSEEDKGIYHAMNKAISIATGEWLNFMNSGDNFLENNILKSVFLNNVQSELIYGDHEIRYETLKKTVKAKEIFEMFKGIPFCHQSMFISKNIQLSYPYQYEKYKFSADFDFIFNYLTSNKYSVLYTNFVISSVEAKGASNKNIYTTIRENQSIVLNKFDAYWVRIYYRVRLVEVFFRETIKLVLPERAVDFVRKLI
ncbi:MAG: glycosyltransferase [Methylophaga sp.]|nr:glycosyltransferase [Methylophaga sp.]